MKPGTAFRESARVATHLNGGFTRLLLERFVGNGHVPDPSLDIPTERIPMHLRAIGSCFVVVWTSARPDDGDSVEAIRAAMHAVTVEER